MRRQRPTDMSLIEFMHSRRTGGRRKIIPQDHQQLFTHVDLESTQLQCLTEQGGKATEFSSESITSSRLLLILPPAFMNS